MSELTERIHQARGLSTAPDPLVEAQKMHEAKTRESDYATFSVETRPLVPGCLNLEALQRLLSKHGKTRKP